MHNYSELPFELRKQRNIFTPVLSYLTGLAQESDIDRIHSNEQNIIATEQILSNEIIQIQAQSKAVLTSLKDQSTKISSLYNDELAIKKALKDLLADTSNTMNQLNMVVTSIEILSDVSIEVNAIFATIDLLPQVT
jgi:septal ring factor EnvC (AmiA/AmiB activator)